MPHFAVITLFVLLGKYVIDKNKRLSDFNKWGNKQDNKKKKYGKPLN